TAAGTARVRDGRARRTGGQTGPDAEAVVGAPMNGGRVEYQFAVLRVVPRVDRGEFVNAGVVLHSRTAEFLGMRAVTDAADLERIAPEVDCELLARYLVCCERICEGDPAGGELAL